MLIPSKHSGYLADGTRTPFGGGKGGSSAPAPHEGLIRKQMESMDIQNESIQEIVANARRMMPYQEAQMRQGLKTAETAYRQSQDDRDWAMGRRGLLTGLQDDIVNDAQNFNADSKGTEYGRIALGDAAQAANIARGTAARGMARSGVNPASGRAQAMDNQLTLGDTALKLQAANMARTAARQEGLQLKTGAANMMAGYPAMGMQATGAGAGYGASGIGLANSGLTGMNSGWGAASGAASSMGSNAASMYGAMGSYKNGADQIASNNDPFNSILGAATGVGMSYALGGLNRKPAG